MVDSGKKPPKKPSRRGLPNNIPYADASHPIFANPTVIGSRANLMRSMSKTVDTLEETESNIGDSGKESSTRRSLKGPSKVMNFPDASHPIYSNPTVIGSRANLMRSRPEAVDASEEPEASPSTPSSSPSVEPESYEKEDSARAEPGSGGAEDH